MHVATHAVPQPNLLLERGISFFTRDNLLSDFLPGELLIVVALDLGEDEGARVKVLCQPPHPSLNGQTAQEVCVVILVVFEELDHVQCTGELQVGQQSRDEVLEYICRFVQAEPHTSCFM